MSEEKMLRNPTEIYHDIHALSLAARENGLRLHTQVEVGRYEGPDKKVGMLLETDGEKIQLKKIEHKVAMWTEAEENELGERLKRFAIRNIGTMHGINLEELARIAREKGVHSVKFNVGGADHVLNVRRMESGKYRIELLREIGESVLHEMNTSDLADRAKSDELKTRIAQATTQNIGWFTANNAHNVLSKLRDEMERKLFTELAKREAIRTEGNKIVVNRGAKVALPALHGSYYVAYVPENTKVKVVGHAHLPVVVHPQADTLPREEIKKDLRQAYERFLLNYLQKGGKISNIMKDEHFENYLLQHAALIKGHEIEGARFTLALQHPEHSGELRISAQTKYYADGRHEGIHGAFITPKMLERIEASAMNLPEEQRRVVMEEINRIKEQYRHLLQK